MSNLMYPDPAILKNIITEAVLSPSKKGYVAPTVYKISGPTFTGWNYYKTLNDAFEKLKYICEISGAKNVTAAGSVSFNTAAAQTLGLNVDFYAAINTDKVVNVPYGIMRSILSKSNLFFIYRFYKADGTGPFYSVYDPRYFSISATVVSSYSADKIAALDTFYREVALLKTKHNSYVELVNRLIQQTPTPAVQQIINEGQMTISNIRAQISTIKGLEVSYAASGTIGFVMLAPIAWFAIAAAVAAWAISNIMTEVEKTKRIQLSYDLLKFTSDQEVRINQEVTAGRITRADANTAIAKLKGIAETATATVKESAKNTSTLGDISTIVKWGVGGLLLFKGMEMISKNS